MRELVGRSTAEQVRTERRAEVEEGVRALLQTTLETYNAGITVVGVQLERADPPTEVADAFEEVQRAQQDLDRFQREAEQYANKRLGDARGQAAQITETAQGYKQQVVAEAEGESQRFLSVLDGISAGGGRDAHAALSRDRRARVPATPTRSSWKAARRRACCPTCRSISCSGTRPATPAPTATGAIDSGAADPAGSKPMRRLSVVLIGVLVVVFLAYSSIFIVNEREQALVLRFGEIKRVIREPGIYFKVPTAFVDTVQIIEDRLLSFDLEDIRVQVRDGRRYIVDAFVAFKITDPRKFRENVSGSLDIARENMRTRLDAALRRVYGQRSFEAALSEQRGDDDGGGRASSCGRSPPSSASRSSTCASSAPTFCRRSRSRPSSA